MVVLNGVVLYGLVEKRVLKGLVEGKLVDGSVEEGIGFWKVDVLEMVDRGVVEGREVVDWSLWGGGGMCGKFVVLGVDIVRVGLDDMMVMVDDLVLGGMLCVWWFVNLFWGLKVRENFGNGEGKLEV